MAFKIQWDAANREHFDEHDRCGAAEVEEVVRSTCHTSRRRRQEQLDPKKSPRFRYEGQTCSGRYLVVIAEQNDPDTIRPVTCWPLVGGARKRYLAWRRTIKSR